MLCCSSKIDIDILSGRFWGNKSHTLLVGEVRQWKEGELTAIVHKPGLLFTVVLMLTNEHHNCCCYFGAGGSTWRN